MRFEQLEFFVELARSSSFTHACKNLHITRQALSASIKNIEHELNAELLIRDVTGITLTEKGFQVLKFAEDILERQKEFYEDFLNFRRLMSRRLSFQFRFLKLYIHIYTLTYIFI